MNEPGFFSTLYNYGWKPTNETLLKESEEGLLKLIKQPYEQEMVDVDGLQINTLKMGSIEKPPLILIHGFGSGIGQWVRNFDDLAMRYRLYACDLIGFGRSSRPDFKGSTVEDAETYFTQILHRWIKKLGHSMGAYLCSVYLLEQDDHDCKKLILADPWGIPEKNPEELKNRSWKISIAMSIANSFSPLSVLRAAGPYGPSLFASVRSDLVGKFDDLEDPAVFARYLYHSNAQIPAGENAFANLQSSFAWAQKPLIHRLPALSKDIPVYFIYGKHTWMDKQAGKVLQNMMCEHKVCTFTVRDAGHQVMLDNHVGFNKVIIHIMDNL